MQEAINSSLKETEDPHPDPFQTSTLDETEPGKTPDEMPHDLPQMRDGVLGVDTQKIYTRVSHLTYFFLVLRTLVSVFVGMSSEWKLKLQYFLMEELELTETHTCWRERSVNRHRMEGVRELLKEWL